MRNNYIKIGGRFLTFLLMFAFMLSSASLAVLKLTFDGVGNINPGHVQYYWSTDTDKGATNDGKTINTSPTIAFDLNDPNKQAKLAEAVPTNIVVFGCNNAFPGSKKIYLRLWDGTTQSENGKYTDLTSFDSSTGDKATGTFDEDYIYIKATPGNGELTKVDVTSSTPLPSGNVTSTVKIYSKMVGRGDNMIVASKRAHWDVIKNEVPESGAANVTSSIYTITNPTEGDVYVLKVQYENLWGVKGLWSDSYTYTAGEAPPSGTAGPVDVTYQFEPGINTFAIPFNVGSDISYRTSGGSWVDLDQDENGEYNIGELMGALIATFGNDNVTVFGWYDSVDQEHEGIAGLDMVMAGGSPDLTQLEVFGTTTAGDQNQLEDINNKLVVANQPYQVTLKTGGTFTLKGTK